MKTKFNCLVVAASIAVALFSCKKKTENVKPTEAETPLVASQEVIFRPKKIFVSSDSSAYRLVFENEYDELGRLKTENYYPDSITENSEPNVLYRKEFRYYYKLICSKTFVRTKYGNLYGQVAWDSIFFKNESQKSKMKSFMTYQGVLETGRDTIGADSYFDFTYSAIGDTLIENSKGIRFNESSNTIRYIDKNNIVVKWIDSAGCKAIDNYKLEGSGSFLSRYVINSGINDNIKAFSTFNRTISCNLNELYKINSNLNWSFDAQGKPTRLTLVENADGIITKSYYRYEY